MTLHKPVTKYHGIKYGSGTFDQFKTPHDHSDYLEGIDDKESVLRQLRLSEDAHHAALTIAFRSVSHIEPNPSPNLRYISATLHNFIQLARNYGVPVIGKPVQQSTSTTSNGNGTSLTQYTLRLPKNAHNKAKIIIPHFDKTAKCHSSLSYMAPVI